MKLYKSKYDTNNSINYYRELLKENCDYKTVRNNLMSDFIPSINSKLADSLLRGTHIINYKTCDELEFIKRVDAKLPEYFENLDSNYNKHISFNNKTYKVYGIVNSLGEFDIDLKNKYPFLTDIIFDFRLVLDYFIYYMNKINNLDDKCKRALCYADRNGDTIVPLNVNGIEVYLLCVPVKVPSHVKLTENPLDIYNSFIAENDSSSFRNHETYYEFYA